MKTRTLSSFGLVTDKTPENLKLAGWKCRGNNPWLDLWVDPRSYQAYAISQAEAIRQDRLTPKYRFSRR